MRFLFLPGPWWCHRAWTSAGVCHDVPRFFLQNFGKEEEYFAHSTKHQPQILHTTANANVILHFVEPCFIAQCLVGIQPLWLIQRTGSQCSVWNQILVLLPLIFRHFKSCYFCQESLIILGFCSDCSSECSKSDHGVIILIPHSRNPCEIKHEGGTNRILLHEYL